MHFIEAAYAFHVKLAVYLESHSFLTFRMRFSDVLGELTLVRYYQPIPNRSEKLLLSQNRAKTVRVKKNP
jgi:hypothetical protein